MELVNSFKSQFAIIMLVSSAKSTGFAEVAIDFGRSFMYSIKRSGPRMEPWGTPHLSGECAAFRKDFGGLFEFKYCCLQHQQECKYDYTRLYCNEPHKFIYTIFKCFKCYFCIHGPNCILNGRVLHYWKCFLCSIGILGTST